MLDQNTDRMWYVIGAVLIGAAIIFGMNTLMPEAFASVGDIMVSVLPNENLVENHEVGLIKWAGADYDRIPVSKPRDWKTYNHGYAYRYDVDMSNGGHVHRTLSQTIPTGVLEEDEVYTWSFFIKNIGDSPISIYGNYWEQPTPNIIGVGESKRIAVTGIWKLRGSKQMQFRGVDSDNISFIFGFEKFELGDQLSPY